MNILFICDEYPPGLNGGIGSITQSLARELIQQGHQVFVVGLYSYEYGELDYEEDNGVRIWRLRYGFKLSRFRKLYRIQRKLPGFLKRWCYAITDFDKFVAFVEQIIDEYKIDIVEQPDWNTFAYLIGLKRPILPKLKVPLVIKAHGSHTYFCQELNKKTKRNWANIDVQIFERADATAFVSMHCQNVNKQLFGEAKQAIVLYNGLDLVNTIPTSIRQSNLVFYSGTLVKKKGIYSLMEAWNQLVQQKPNTQLIVFGKGSIKSAQKKLSQEAIQSVTFYGHRPKTELIEYLNLATVAIFPSYSETFGLGAVEAMSVACPTIFTKRTCGPEIIEDGFNGLLVDPDNPTEICEKLLLLIENPTFAKKIGLQGKLKVTECYNIKTTAERHIKWYHEVISSFYQTMKNNE